MCTNPWTPDLRAVVIMSNHVYMIFIPLVDIQESGIFLLARITKAIKSASAHLINRQAGVTGRVWPEESFDRGLRVAERLDEKIAYMLDNPIRQGLVHSAEEYRWLGVAPPALEPSLARPGK
jgi:hypothetical protein